MLSIHTWPKKLVAQLKDPCVSASVDILLFGTRRHRTKSRRRVCVVCVCVCVFVCLLVIHVRGKKKLNGQGCRHALITHPGWLLVWSACFSPSRLARVLPFLFFFFGEFEVFHLGATIGLGILLKNQKLAHNPPTNQGTNRDAHQALSVLLLRHDVILFILHHTSADMIYDSPSSFTVLIVVIVVIAGNACSVPGL